jgi:hypothetical protein
MRVTLCGGTQAEVQGLGREVSNALKSSEGVSNLEGGGPHGMLLNEGGTRTLWMHSISFQLNDNVSVAGKDPDKVCKEICRKVLKLLKERFPQRPKESFHVDLQGYWSDGEPDIDVSLDALEEEEEDCIEREGLT